jgi:kynureninase
VPIPIDADFARELDRADALAHFRGEFVIGDPDVIYLDGNSLGRLPRRCVDRIRDVVERQWGHRLIRAWGDDWFDGRNASERRSRGCSERRPTK